jgi:hypothetical protein
MPLTRTVKIDIVDREFRAEVAFAYHRGRSGSSVEPPESPFAEVQSVTLLGADDKPLVTPPWLHELIASADYIQDELIEYATEA